MRLSQVANAIAEGGNVGKLLAEERIRGASARWPLNRERSADTAWRRKRMSRGGLAVYSFLPLRTITAARGYVDRHSSTISESFPQMTDSMEKVAFHTPACEAQYLRDLFAGQTFQTPQDEDLSLTRGEHTKEAPDTLLPFTAEDLLFRSQTITGKLSLLKFRVLLSPPLPPRGSASITTGIDRDPSEPCLPRQNLTVALTLFHQLEKHFLGNLFGFMSVDQEQAAQLENPRVMRAAEFFATGGCSQ